MAVSPDLLLSSSCLHLLLVVMTSPTMAFNQLPTLTSLEAPFLVAG